MKRHAPPRKGPPRAGPRERVDWLSRALSRSGVPPLNDAEAAIREGRVAVEGRIVRQPMVVVRPTDAVTLDGHRVSLEATNRVLAFHKPKAW